MTRICRTVSHLVNHQNFWGAIFGGIAVLAASLILCFPNISRIKAYPVHQEFDRHCGRLCVYSGDTGFILTKYGLIPMTTKQVVLRR